MKRLLTLFAVVVISTTFFCQAFDWEWQNSKPHSNELRAIKIIAPNTIVGFASAGTVQKSTDNGTTWSVKYVDPSGRAFRSADFVDAFVGYACGSNGLLMKTTDGGETFTELNPGTSVFLYDVDFIDADTGYVGGASGLLIKTTDGGANWTTITTTGYTTQSIYAVSAPSADAIYLGCTSTSSVRKSTDYGASWQNVSPLGFTGQTIWDIYFLDESTGWFVYQYLGGIYRTTDGGNSWALSNVPNTLVVLNSINFNSDASVGVVSNNNNGSVFRSTNGGADWIDVGTGVEPQYATAVGGSTVFSVGRAGTCYKSTDGGATYSPLFISATTTQIRQIRFLNETTGLAGAGSSITSDSLGYLIKTTDGGNTWTALPYNFKHQVNSLWLASDNVWYVGRGRNAIFKTTDGGSTFFQQTQPLSGTSHFYDIAFSDENNGYAFSAGGGIIKTSDGGTNWVSANSPFGTTTVYNGVVFNSDTVIAVGGSAKAFKTTNGGTNWSALSPGIPGNFFAVRFYDANFGVIAGFSSPNPVATKTTDGGSTWIPLTLPSEFGANSIWGIGFKDTSTFWLTGINGLVGYTTDGGSTWTVAKKVTANTLFSAAVVGNDMWLSGDRGTILKGFSDPTIQEIKKINITALIEGFYNGSSMISDTVTVELHEDNSPYGVVETTKTVLNSNGNGTATFIKYAKSTTPYYIAVKHRNGLETWSATPQTFSGGVLNYNFTTAATQAYGSNLKLKGGKWCIYSGDIIPQDGLIDLSDVVAVVNDSNNFISGTAVPTDVNGDDNVDLSDILIVINNSNAFVSAQTP